MANQYTRKPNVYHPSQRSARTPEQYTKESAIGNSSGSRLYYGVVRDTKDEQHMGRLSVWIPELSGDADDPKQWKICSYCTPFGGASFLDNGTFKDKEGNDAIKRSTERAKQMGRLPDKQEGVFGGRQSYGMWFVPPDIGTEVIVSNIVGFGWVWLGCVYPQDMTGMIPGIAQEKVLGGERNEEGPVMETDLTMEPSRTGTTSKKKAYTPLRDGLRKQGLNGDGLRGQSTSSASRDTTSEVMGLLTPNGTQIVLDDNPESNYIRLRTKSGTQITLSETDGFIYLTSRDGKTWVELSNAGNIDMYAEFNISMHAEKGSINLMAGKDVNIQGSTGFNIKSQDISLLSDSDINIKGGGNIAIQVAGNMNLKSGGNLLQTSGGSNHLSAGVEFRASAPGIFLNCGGGQLAADAVEPVSYNPSGPSTQNSNGTWSSGKAYEVKQSYVARVPQHEPSYHDESGIIDPSDDTPEGGGGRVRTTRENGDIPVGNEPPIMPGKTPTPTNGVCGLSPEELQNVMDALGFRESRSKYGTVNTLGFTGKYQFGVAALEDRGLLKKGSFDRLKSLGSKNQGVILDNPNNWTIPGGKEAFRNNPQLQEDAMVKNMEANCKSLSRMGVVNAQTEKEKIGGLLAAAHLGGSGGAKKISQGIVARDAYGGGTNEYYSIGNRAVKSVKTTNSTSTTTTV